ncbi:hypothetical protein GOC40_32360 [Sinorhizobium meliloti]|nr:hypothetical protein [Sinorhizobium meliloti]
MPVLARSNQFENCGCTGTPIAIGIGDEAHIEELFMRERGGDDDQCSVYPGSCPDMAQQTGRALKSSAVGGAELISAAVF